MKNIMRFFSVTWLSILFILCIWQATEGHFVKMDVNQILEKPSLHAFFGTDSLGRDLLSRVLNGTQTSFLVGILSVAVSMLIGVLCGVISGWFAGFVDRTLMRLTELLLAIPSYVLVMILTLFIQSFIIKMDLQIRIYISLIFGIGLSHWMNIARTVRGMTVKIKNEAYIEAAYALGATNIQIIKSHVLPNMKNQIVSLGILQIASNILYEGFVSFLGLGLQAPQTSLGLLVQEGWRSLSSFPHLMLFPALILFLTIWSIQILADHYFKH